MKFCKNLQRVAEISDPAWAPYWLDYKVLKKLINQLPSLVPADETRRPAADPSEGSSTQQRGDATTEGKDPGRSREDDGRNGSTREEAPGHKLGDNPREVSFFKALHAELKKGAHFFDCTTNEFEIRLQRVTVGLEITKDQNTLLKYEKWRLMSQSIYRLYRDLLLLETFAIMNYCGFSKILKKHDKVTGYDTRIAYMHSIVNNASFTHYPKVLAMIARCERLYEEVTHRLIREGKKDLLEDERLFISMIQVLNEQVLESSDEDSILSSSRKPAAPSRRTKVAKIPNSGNESPQMTSLRQLVEENDWKPKALRLVSDSAHVAPLKRSWDDDSEDEEDSKPPAKHKK